MTGDRPDPEGGPSHAALFESFPDPVLAYSTQPDSTLSTGGANSVDGSPLVSAINPAFESTFDTEATEIVGVPLSECELSGIVSVDHHASGKTDWSEVLAPGMESVERNQPKEGPIPESATSSTQSGPTTLGSILECVTEAGGDARFELETDDRSRYFRVESIETASTIAVGYLLFTDVTDFVEERRDLARTIEQLERITSVAGHDIRNPLEVAKIRLDAARDTGDVVHFEKVEGALDRIERLVLDVLAAGGGRAGSADTVSIKTVAEDAWDTVDTGTATLEIATDLPTVRGDADRLRQLFENLFRNAVEHGSSGPGATVGSDDGDDVSGTPSTEAATEDEIEDGDPYVTISIASTQDGFVVADDGPGILDEIRGQVFEAGVTTDADSSGLGLSIVRRIAREHGWTVSLGSRQWPDRDGTGAQFTFAGVEDIEGEGSVGDSGREQGSNGATGSNGST